MRIGSRALKRFAADQSGVVTIDWVAVTAMFVVIGILIVYGVFGDSNTGLVGLVNGQAGKVAVDGNNISTLEQEVDTWVSGQSGS